MGLLMVLTFNWMSEAFLRRSPLVEIASKQITAQSYCSLAPPSTTDQRNQDRTYGLLSFQILLFVCCVSLSQSHFRTITVYTVDILVSPFGIMPGNCSKEG